MLATVTDKGQVTVPKGIRDRAGIAPGSKLDFVVQEDGTLHVRVLGRGAATLFGLMHRPGRGPISIEQMDADIASVVEQQNRPDAT